MRLRALREYTGRTQLEVELDASLGIGYLQRVESGKVRYPERDTLERILGALGAHYTERRDILELFGYVVDTPLPDEPETRWAVDVCRAELDDAVFPAYLLDCGHRLLAWNVFVPRLFRDTLPAIETDRASMLRVLFDPAYHLTGRIANPVLFFPAQIRALRYEMRLFRGESWYDALIAALRSECSLFERYWAASPADQRASLIAARPLVPLELHTPDGLVLRFWLTSEPFAQDRRFRIIYYVHAESSTIQHCIAWTQLGYSDG